MRRSCDRQEEQEEGEEEEEEEEENQSCDRPQCMHQVLP
eukprot:SAG22_NODE_474_length_10034_cov_21.356517_10_plen_39_part_00